MKKKVKTVLNLLAVCFLSGIIFIGVGYLYLNRELKPTENKTESVPYYPEAPESAGVMFDICGDRTLCYMNFEDGSLNILFDTDKTITNYMRKYLFYSLCYYFCNKCRNLFII